MSGLPHTVTLMTTNRCTANCRTCGVGAGPGGSKSLSLRAMFQYIDEAAEIRVRLIVFSGGEPFLLGEDLVTAVRYAASAGLLTRVVSNAYWATSGDIALEQLGRLKQAGLCEVNFSTGDFHQQFVPIQNVLNGIIAAVALEMTCAVMVELHKKSVYTPKNLLNEEQLSVILKNPEKRALLVVLESPWVDVNRDASQNQEDCQLLTAENLDFRIGCTSVIGGVAVNPDESLWACCGITCKYIPELMVGSLKQNSMRELIEVMKHDFLRRWLFTQGPEHILAWAAERDHGIVWERKYAHQCHACYAVYNNPAIRSVLAEHYKKKLMDVCFQYWLMSRYADQCWERVKQRYHQENILGGSNNDNFE